MGFFKNKINIDPAAIKIELDDDRIVINGKAIDIPTHINALTAMFGKPRAVAGPRDNPIDKRLSYKPKNYAWDRLGLYCYTKNGSVIFCFGIRLNAGELCPKTLPKALFSGTVSIKGMPWHKAAGTLPNIEADMLFFKKIALGGYSAIIEYADFEADPDLCTEKDYTNIEIQLI